MSEDAIRDRIAQRLSDLNLSMREASLRAGLGGSYVRDYLHGRAQLMKAENLVKLAPALETTAEWLLTGHGNRSASDNPEIAELVRLLPRLPKAARESLLTLARTMVESSSADDRQN